MSAAEIDTLWRSAFGESAIRPLPYSSEELGDDGWRPLTDPQNFIMNLANLNHQQLYAASANNQLAMIDAQNEYLELERHMANIKGKETIKNPQDFPAPDVFEERKEAALYGYKYDANRPALLHAGIPGLRSADDLTEREKHDVRLFQEPFEQGGFVPKEREYRAKVAKAKDPKNVDGWIPIDKDGKRLIPRQQTHHEEYNITYVKRNVDENGEIIRPQSPESSEVPGETPDKAVNKRLTRTRFDGKKFPPTRDVSEAPSAASTPGKKRASPPGADTREDTPNSKRRKILLTVNGEQPKPKHPNQYTKAKEREMAATHTTPAQASAKPVTSSSSSSSKPTWRELSPMSRRTHKWTDPELIESIKEDHTWLHDDPKRAEEWKHKLLNGINPVRSLSMLLKWNYWQVTNQAKRPRAKKNPAEQDDSVKEIEDSSESQKPRRRVAKPKKADGSGRSTPATTPAPDFVNGVAAQAPKPGLNTRAAKSSRRPAGADGAEFRDKIFVQDKRNGTSGAKQPGTETEPPSRGDDEVAMDRNGKDLNGKEPSHRRPSMKREESDSTIVINSKSSAPSTRRSLRSARRSSG
ncbi:uncharacterized protein Z520_02060 [Fonsecaea multimorphosa CBS 102226]|uniref:Uncharacterized protein n=1 Tax=Fonsecaea multimorphosa CBS 102226 TaxID=1442371 RepID=A0A0D2IY38_9EURO|nr:uncharacterized protein Z520_02060 [Fonsecaea multimorphosa CBS 102226]KIY01922.1 hypothetical protein Z520_02060 [Fonsecaea multimorphosa CBS 102226]OAL29605.1 hypothetical protein AYO22_02019 [Fonsecaea multimorphosa]